MERQHGQQGAHGHPRCRVEGCDQTGRPRVLSVTIQFHGLGEAPAASGPTGGFNAAVIGGVGEHRFRMVVVHDAGRFLW